MTPAEFVALHPEARDVIALLQARIDGLETVVAEQALTIERCLTAMRSEVALPVNDSFGSGVALTAHRALRALGQEP